MSKIITAAQAAELVQDGCTLTTTGFNGFGCPEDLMMALADHFAQTSHPKTLRWSNAPVRATAKAGA